MFQVNLTEASTRISDLVNAALHGEEVFIVTPDQQRVQLIPATLRERHPQFGSAKGLIVLADDFDAPLEDFSEPVA